MDAESRRKPYGTSTPKTDTLSGSFSTWLARPRRDHRPHRLPVHGRTVGLTGAVAVIAAHLWLKANRARLEHDIDLWDERAWQHKGKR